MIAGIEKILHVDLTTGQIRLEHGTDGAALLGGRGRNAGILFRELKPGTDALGPENVLAFSTGPLTGTLAPAAARYNVSARSPLTGYFGDSNSGGFWAAELRYAGYDGLVFHGRAASPVYLLITDGKAVLCDASHLWGQTTRTTTDRLRREYADPGLKVACIGPAGENLVKFACIINDYARAAGRTGMGAVMGSKNLKAIAVRGTGGVGVAQPDVFADKCRELRQTIRESRQFQLYHQSGPLGHYGPEDYREDSPLVGIAGFKYQSASLCDKWGEARGKSWWRSHWTKLKACSGCLMHCSHFYSVRTGPMAGVMGDGPEAEPTAWFSYCLGDVNRDLVAYAYRLCNELGLDCIEMGSAIGALMTWYAQGVVDDGALRRMKAGYLRPKWGDAEAILSLIEMTARRQGIGDMLAAGAHRMSLEIGGEAPYWVLQNKGMSVGAADRRAQKGGVLNHMVSTRGPDHLRGSPSLEFYGFTGDEKIRADWLKYIGEAELFEHAVKLTSYRGKAPLVIWQEHLRVLADSLGVCSFNYGNWPNTPVYPEDFAELFSAATGIQTDAAEMLGAAARSINLEKAFNVREGWQRGDDQPPARWVNEPKDAGIFKGEKVDPAAFNEMLDEYYARRGWDGISGLPLRAGLVGLGLEAVADELAAMGKLG